MEFGVSPIPETRDAMVQRGSLFGVPTYRCIGPGESISFGYRAELQRASMMPRKPIPHATYL
jgi:hypothetical protein